MSDNRSIAYQEGNLSIYRASGVGSCLTALVAAKLGYEEARSEYSQNILTNAAREGNLHEDAVIDTLTKEHGYKCWGGQDVMESKVIPNVFIRGHIDGFCRPPRARKDRLLEVKTMSRDRFKKWIALGDDARSRLLTDEFEKYAWQISAYMWHYGLSAMYVVKNRDSGVLDISEIVTPPIDKKTIRKKIIQAEMWGKRGELPPCAAASGDKFFCPYPYLHNDSPFQDEPENEDAPFEDATMTLLAGMAEIYSELQAKVGLMKPLDDERKDLGKKVIETMGGRDYVEAGGFKIKVVPNNRAYVNKAKAAEAFGVTVEEYDAIMEASKGEPKSYPYIKVEKMGDK